MKTVLAALVVASTVAFAIQAFASEPTFILRGVDKSVQVRSDFVRRNEQAHDVATPKKVRVVLASPYAN